VALLVDARGHNPSRHGLFHSFIPAAALPVTRNIHSNPMESILDTELQAPWQNGLSELAPRGNFSVQHPRIALFHQLVAVPI
jgi:hypothetical protein